MQTEASTNETTTRVRVIEPFTFNGRTALPNEVVELLSSDAGDLIRRGRAELAD